MTFNRFISYSLIIHLIALTALFLAHGKKEHKETPFFARLVTPEETLPAVKTPAPVIPPARKFRHLAPSITKQSPRELFSEQSGLPAPRTWRLQDNASSEFKSPQAPEAKGNANDIPSENGVIPSGKGSSHPLKRENLFDSEIIASSAKKADEQEHKNSVSFDSGEFKYYGYMQRLKEKIEGLWRYPSEEASKGIYGDLLIDFTIRKDGSLGSVEVVRTSGHRGLDEAAVRALRDAAPYWPLPESFKKDALTISGHFIYTLYGAYIR